MKKYELLTVDYEGHEIEGFIDLLKRFKVSRLIDVREIPLSRKRGFSKSVLKQRLDNENIEHIHIKALGFPGEMLCTISKVSPEVVTFIFHCIISQP